MRILIDCHVFDHEFQGSRTVLKGLYTKLFEIEETTPSGDLYFLAANDIENLKKEFPPLPFIRYIQLRSGRSWQRLIYEFPRVILKYKINIAHFQYIVPPLKFCRYIVTCHDVLFLDFPEYFGKGYIALKKFLYKSSYKASDVVTTVSDYSYERISHHFGNKNAFYSIHNGIDEKFFNFIPLVSKKEWLNKNELRPYLLFISRFEPRKNHHLLLRAFVEGEFYKNHDLVLIGKRTLSCPEFDSYYQDLSSEIKCRVHINSDGVSDHELLNYMKFADVSVYPSAAEGFGLPALEAAAMKTPVICNNATAMQDFCFLGKYLVKIDVLELKRLLHDILYGDRAIIKLEMQEISQKIATNYSWRNAAIKFKSILAALS